MRQVTYADHSGRQLTPTLVVGLGGTGVQVVRRLKAAFEDYFSYRNLGSMPHIFRFLAVDSVPLSNANGQADLERQEYVYLGRVDGDQVIKNPRFHPEIDSWWDRKRSLPGHIDDGCGQMRDVGRMVLFFHYEDFLSRLLDQIHGVLEHESFDEAGHRGFSLRRDQLRICVVCSVAGGTGSGTFLDVAYNVRHAVSRITGITTSIVGYLALPEVFLPELNSTAMRESVQANGYAALSELEYLNRFPEHAHDVFHAYPSNHKIDVTRRPFDHTFLVGVRDQEGEGLSSPDQVYDAIAQKIYLESIYLDQAMTERAVNMHFADSDAAGDIGGTGIGRYYSSFSVNDITVRRDMVLNYCRYRLILDTLHRLLHAEQSDEELPNPPEEIEAGALIEEIGRAVMKSRPAPELLPGMEPESKVLLQTLDSNEGLLERWLKDTDRPLQEQAREKQQAIRQHLVNQVWKIALDRGIDAVFPYLNSWQRRLESTADTLRSQTAQTDAEIDRLHRAYEHDRTELDELGPGPGMHILLWDSTAKRRHYRERLFTTARTNTQGWYEERFEREVLRQIGSVIVHSLLGDTIQDERGSLSRLIEQWKHLRDVFASIERDLERVMEDHLRAIKELDFEWGAFAIAREISLSPAELEELYNEIGDMLDSKGLLDELANWLQTERGGEADDDSQLAVEMRRHLLIRAREVCLPAFADRLDPDADLPIKQAAGSVKEALSHRLGEYVAQPGVVDSLFRYNAPFWNFFGATNAEDALERLNLVAAESRSPSGWERATPDDVLETSRKDDKIPSDDETIVETGDPSLLGVYRARYGLPLFLLNEMPDMREQYMRRRSLNMHGRDSGAGMSLHITATWNDEPPCDPSLDEKGQPLLAGRAE